MLDEQRRPERDHLREMLERLRAGDPRVPKEIRQALDSVCPLATRWANEVGA